MNSARDMELVLSDRPGNPRSPGTDDPGIEGSDPTNDTNRTTKPSFVLSATA